MDYLFLSSLRTGGEHDDVVVSYDIACQWCINLLERIRNYASSIQPDEETQDVISGFTYLVPKFHLPAHVGSCQTQYSFNFHQHVGRTDGEAPERGWSHINPIALSTREMGPGSRRDTLDDHFGDLNWKKSYQMGITLLKRIKTAVKESSEQTLLFHRYDLGLRKKLGDEVNVWEEELIAWENDRSCPNPFESRIKKPTQEAVRRALAEEDRKAQQEGTAYVLHSMFSGSELIAVGLELEEQQRRVHIDTKSLGLHSTDDQKAKLLTKGNGLYRRIAQWIEVQERYIPSTYTLRQDEASAANSIKEPWETPLFLPSSIPHSTPCDARLQDAEWRLRSAQAHTALDELRRTLRLRAYLYIDKDKSSRGQHQNTRSHSHIHRTQTKVDAAVAKYRAARASIASLASLYTGSDWKNEFPILKDEDIRSLEKKKAEPAEGRRKVSWIWGVLGDGDVTMENDELKDVEWCKSRARSKRWKEEVLLLQEEMRRVLMFFESEAETWKSRTEVSRANLDEVGFEGFSAYALQQAALRFELKCHFETLWTGVDDYVQSKGKAEILPLETIVEEPVDEDIMDCSSE
ncbi:hypothetical protein BDN72DRAFT_782249 [Pluteus cervinus]|uniref:Uncharacterized protein n=1 Tax=Pluteus cervinus TaxID=181527 RepID=A0ACD2ZY24_9AGAR|nr:hypothetical protein BDN72DRAFT_782249 [Pluteus cervinus]